MNWSAIDWKVLERLRAGFLAGSAGAADYWQSESDLANYDATFAQRIGWKWDYVLMELQRRGWQPAPGALLDWGCGSGIAHRAFLDHFGVEYVSELRLWDRSALATRFAQRRAKTKYPGLNVELERSGLRERPTPDPSQEGNTSPATLLVSHVLTELKPDQVEALADFAANFTSVLWVEPGTHEASLALIGVRERLRDKMNVVAPCTHQAQCGLRAPGNQCHWCHHFAAPPPEIFMDGNWAKFGELAGVDLRSLPLSFLVLDRRPLSAPDPEQVRVLGRPRVYKAHALMLGCDAAGVAEKRLMKRRAPEFFRQLKRGECDPLQQWRCEGEEIIEVRPFNGPA
jgi:ribosomal protein RSM22 (predicted rRNA methylase)